MFVFRTFITLITFYQNQEYISTELCEQRALVINTCNGSCELQKQISKLLDVESPQQSPQNNKQTVEESLHNLINIWSIDEYLVSTSVISCTHFLFSVQSHTSEPCSPPPQFS